MTSALFASVAATGFAIAFLHAALPTHWLPFVLVARGRHWALSKTLGVTAVAGAGHVVATVLIGGVLTGLGMAVRPQLGGVFPLLVGALLIAFGLYQLARHLRVRAAPRVEPDRGLTDGASILGLVALLALSPSEAFLPLFLANSEHGWVGFAVLSAILTAGTMLGMLVFTGLSLVGAARLNLARLERYEGAILGVALCLLGVGVIALEG